MFDVKNFTPVSKRLADALNYVVDDLRCHNRPQLKGFRFVSRGPETAYLKVPGDPKGAVVVSLCDGDNQAIIFFHPTRTGKEAWEMSSTQEGCYALCADEDMDEDRFWVYPEHGLHEAHAPYVPSRVGGPVPPGLYDVVLSALGRFVSCAEVHRTVPDECYF